MYKLKAVIIIVLFVTIYCIGIGAIGLALHEGYHAINSEEIREVCFLGISKDDGAIGWVYGTHPNRFNTEWYAYSVNVIVTILGVYLFVKCNRLLK